MSLTATKAVWEMRGLTSPERLVLLCIADFANEQMVAWAAASRARTQSESHALVAVDGRPTPDE